jgi:uncharacterized phiE125 gp8 family phage protein
MPTVKIVDATTEPISLAEAKLHLRVDGSDEDALITALVKAVRQACEAECRRTLIDTTWELVLDAFSEALELHNPRILSVTSVKYIDLAGAEQTLDPVDYVLDKDSEPGWLVPAYGKRWPDTREQINAVRVRYHAGYGTQASDVPQVLKQWMLLHLSHYYKNRESTFAGTITQLPFAGSLLDGHRVLGF